MPRSTLVDAETGESMLEKAPGSNDPHLRLHDLDQEGIWAELIYPSLAIWAHSIRDPELLAVGCAAVNDWAIEYQKVSQRYVCNATIPTLDVDHAVAEVVRAAGWASKRPSCRSLHPVTMIGTRRSGSLSGRLSRRRTRSSATTLAPSRMTNPRQMGSITEDRGAILNYMETTFGGQRAVAKMIATGVFDRHPRLKAIVSEGGATWGPFIADRLDEAYRQHGSVVRPRLERLPSEYLYNNV